MSARARVDSMRPERPGRTRTADPKLPDLYWTRGRYLPYIAFGSCGLVITAVALGILNAVWVLGEHDPAAWQELLALYARVPLLVLHAFMLVALTWFGLRFFGLFPKTQPARIGPFPRPPQIFFTLALNGAFVVASLLVMLVLGGALP
jgi:hypothetical protein